MSLEQSIVDLTHAVKENSALLRELSVLLDKKIQHVGNELPIGAATEKVIKTASEGSRTLLGHSSTEQSKTAAEAAKEDPTLLGGVPDETTERLLDFQRDIVKPFGALCVAKGRDAGAAILKKWGVEKISHIPADKHAELLADIINASA